MTYNTNIYIDSYPEGVDNLVDGLRDVREGFYDTWELLDEAILSVLKEEGWYNPEKHIVQHSHNDGGLYDTSNLHKILIREDIEKHGSIYVTIPIIIKTWASFNKNEDGVSKPELLSIESVHYGE